MNGLAPDYSNSIADELTIHPPSQYHHDTENLLVFLYDNSAGKGLIL